MGLCDHVAQLAAFELYAKIVGGFPAGIGGRDPADLLVDPGIVVTLVQLPECAFIHLVAGFLGIEICGNDEAREFQLEATSFRLDPIGFAVPRIIVEGGKIDAIGS